MCLLFQLHSLVGLHSHVLMSENDERTALLFTDIYQLMMNEQPSVCSDAHRHISAHDERTA